MNKQKHVFWQAFLVAGLIFTTGILIGFGVESWRAEEISELYKESEFDMLDARIMTEAISRSDFDCKVIEKKNIEFADRIYEEALVLDELESSQKITESLELQHKKYDLLRTMLWVNSMKIKRQCNSSYSNIVYLYQYDEPSLDKKAKQKVFSDFLQNLKREYKGEVLLIPIAGDFDFISLDFLKEIYGIDELPVILIDEKYKIKKVNELTEIESFLNKK